MIAETITAQIERSFLVMIQRPISIYETNATTELNYVYRDAGSVGRATLFRSVLSNLLHPGGVFSSKDAKAYGEELEWSQQIAPPVKIDGGCV